MVKFVIGDLHFQHRNIIKWSSLRSMFSTIEEHDAGLISEWNSVVGPEDTVFVLGDVAFNKSGLQLVQHLNGYKRLVMGNHDNYGSARYLQYFNSLHGCVEYSDCILTHIPVHPSQLARWVGNIHGHLHSEVIDDPRYACVSAEQTGLRPVPIDEVVVTIRSRI